MDFNFGKCFSNFESSCTLLFKVVELWQLCKVVKDAQSSIGRFADPGGLARDHLTKQARLIELAFIICYWLNWLYFYG